MNSHPVNLALRFLLEIAALASVAIWGWHKGAGIWRFVLAIGLPVLVAFLWATFRVPNDPGTAPVAIPGILRLAFELALFAFSTWALYDIRWIPLAWALGITTALHYIASYDRILWIVKQ